LRNKEEKGKRLHSRNTTMSGRGVVFWGWVSGGPKGIKDFISIQKRGKLPQPQNQAKEKRGDIGKQNSKSG